MMAQFVPMGGAAPVRQRQGPSQDMINLQLLQALAGNIGQVGQQFRAQQELAEKRTADQAFADVLAGRAGGQLGAGGMGPPTPANPNAMPTPEQIQAMVIGGRDPSAFFPQAITPFEQARLELERQKLAQPDLPSSVREARALGFDLSTPEGQAGYAQYRQSLTRPPAGTTITLPGAGSTQAVGPDTLTGLRSATNQLFDPQTGEINLALLGATDLPVIGSIGPGSDIRSKIETAIAVVAENRGISIEDATRIYMPSITDGAAGLQKLRRLEQDLSSVLGASGGQVPVLPERAESSPGVFDEVLDFATQAFGGGDAGGLPLVRNQADYDALPPGTRYRNEAGETGTKR